MNLRWGAGLVVAVIIGGWTGHAVGAPEAPMAQTSGTSSSGGGGSSGDGSGGDAGGGDGSQDSGDGDASQGSGGGDGSHGADDGEGGGDASATTDPPTSGSPTSESPTTDQPAAESSHVDDGRIADAEESDCDGDGGGRRCYRVDDADGVSAVRVPDGSGGTVVVPIGAVPVVNVDSGASTSASSNVDLAVDVDVTTNRVVRVERRIDPVRQFALITFAALFGAFIGAAVLGTYMRFRRGPR